MDNNGIIYGLIRKITIVIGGIYKPFPNGGHDRTINQGEPPNGRQDTDFNEAMKSIQYSYPYI